MSPASSRRRTQGIARYSLLILIVLIAAAGGVIYWQIKHGDDADQPSPQQVVAAAGPVIRAGIGTDELLGHAREAIAAQRLLAPAGNNALEFYLAVLKREPGNRVAQDALREIFPFAAHAAEQTIDSGDDAEAQRQIELLTHADPQNYTLTLLQAKLQAQRTTVAQLAAVQAEQANRREPSTATISKTAAQTLVTPSVAVAPAPAPITTPPPVAPARPSNAMTPAEQAIAQLNVESTSVEAAPKSSMRARVPAPAPAPAAIVADANGASAPILTRRVEPAYPPDAKRTRRQGWVDVVFTVEPDGTVIGATVADADPKYVFDRAALGAVSRWQFTPGTQDGKPVASQMRQRIEFRL